MLLQKRLRTNNGFLKTQGFSSKKNYIFTSCPKFQVKIINFCSNPSSKSNVMKKPSAKMMMEKEHGVFCRRSDSTNPRELSPRQKERIKNVAETFPQGYRKSTVGSWKSQSGCAWKAPLEVICSNPSAQGNPREQPAQKTWASLPHQKLPVLPSDPAACPLTSVEQLVLHAVALHLLLAVRLLPAHLQGGGPQGGEDQTGRGVGDAQRQPGI